MATTTIPNNADGDKAADKKITPEVKTFTQEEVNVMMGKIRNETRTNNDVEITKRLEEMEKNYNSLTYETSFKNTAFASASEEQRKQIDELTGGDPKKLEVLSKTGFTLSKEEVETPQREEHFHTGGNKNFTEKDLETKKTETKEEKQNKEFQEMIGISTTK